MLRSGLPVPCMTYRLLKHQLANKDCMLGSVVKKITVCSSKRADDFGCAVFFVEDDSHHFGVGMGLALDAVHHPTTLPETLWLEGWNLAPNVQT